MKETILQRLFSTFANGWPGKGLMILRLALSLFLFHDASARLMESTASAPAILQIVSAATGLFLFLGLWTPIAGGLATILQLWIVYSCPGNFWTTILAAAIATGLALIGPGAWSLDAIAYGRKRISIRDR